MINGLEGIPGSGKSYEATVYHVLEALKDGRLVVTNLPLIVPMFAAINPDFRRRIEIRVRPAPVRGTWSPDRIQVDEEGNVSGEAFQLFQDGHLEAAPAGTKTFGHVWDYYHTFKDKKGRGPLFVIDECHVPFPRLGTDKAVIEWFKLHRHYNADVLFMTQSFRDMCAELAGLVAILIKVRKADILGKADHYIRKVHAGYRGGLVSEEQRKYRPEFFGLYKSHTQGNSAAETKAQDMSPFIVKFNRLKWAVFGLAGVATVWAWWPQAEKPARVTRTTTRTYYTDANRPAWLVEADKNRGKPLAIAPTPIAAASEPVQAAPAKPSPVEILRGGTSQPTGDAGEIPEPYGSKNLHITGLMTMSGRTVYTLSVSQAGQLVSSVTDGELRKIGYKFQPLSDCAATVEWGKRVRSITCDSPSLSIAAQPRA